MDQGYSGEELEILISDEGSTDDTLKIAREFGITAYVEPGRTCSKGRNLFLQKARSEIIVMLDSDEVIPPGWLSKAEEIFKDTSVAEVSGPYYSPEPESGLVARVIYFLTSGWQFSSKSGRKMDNWP